MGAYGREIRFVEYDELVNGGGSRLVGFLPIAGLDASDLQGALEIMAAATVRGASGEAPGFVLLSVAPEVPEVPVAVGDNDERMTDARRPKGTAGGDLGGSYPDPRVQSRAFEGRIATGGSEVALPGAAFNNYVPVPFNSASFNTAGKLTGLEQEFVPDRAGLYWVGGTVLLSGATVIPGEVYRLAVFRNGVRHLTLAATQASGARELSLGGWARVQMNGATDRLTLRVNTSGNLAPSATTDSHFGVSYAGASS